jgi:hypothetical protein
MRSTLSRIGQFVEAPDRLLVHEFQEAIVARHAAFAVTHHVDRGEVDHRPVGPHQLAQEVRVVVDGDRAGIGDAEGIEDVGEIPVLALEDAELVEIADHAVGRRHRRQQAPVGGRAHRQVVTHQRVQ